MTLFDAALRGTLVALLLLLAAAMLRDRPNLVLARIGAVFCAGLIVQVVGSTPTFEASVPLRWQAPLIAVSVGNAVLFWIFVQALFDDEFSLQPWHIAAWLIVAAVSAGNCAGVWSSSSVAGRIGWAVQRAAPLVFAVLAAIAATATWRLDLVEKRRRLRKFIVVTGVAYTVVMLGVRLASPQGRLLGSTATLDVAALLAMVSVVAFAILRVVQTDLFPQPQEPCLRVVPRAASVSAGEAKGDDEAPPVPDAGEERLAAALQRLVDDEHVYRVEGLTVARLADRLAVPEYRLRRLINRRLGHRNFNAFINAYRLDEARASLADPGLRERPVLTIALDAGFQSIGPFNRAFKAATGLTPTEFRRQRIAES